MQLSFLSSDKNIIDLWRYDVGCTYCSVFALEKQSDKTRAKNANESRARRSFALTGNDNTEFYLILCNSNSLILEGGANQNFKLYYHNNR